MVLHGSRRVGIDSCLSSWEDAAIEYIRCSMKFFNYMQSEMTAILSGSEESYISEESLFALNALIITGAQIYRSRRSMVNRAKDSFAGLPIPEGVI